MGNDFVVVFDRSAVTATVEHQFVTRCMSLVAGVNQSFTFDYLAIAVPNFDSKLDARIFAHLPCNCHTIQFKQTVYRSCFFAKVEQVPKNCCSQIAFFCP